MYGFPAKKQMRDSTQQIASLTLIAAQQARKAAQARKAVQAKQAKQAAQAAQAHNLNIKLMNKNDELKVTEDKLAAVEAYLLEAEEAVRLQVEEAARLQAEAEEAAEAARLQEEDLNMKLMNKMEEIKVA